MISIGLTSGLGSIACSVLQATEEPEVVWWEVMPGPRKRRDVSHHRRYHAHLKMFEIIFDRWPPSVIALGPPSTKDEPLEWVVFMRTAIFELGKSVRVPVVLFDTNAAIARSLGAPEHGRGNGLKTLIQREITDFRSNKRRVILSTATAIAGAHQVRGSMSSKENTQ